MPVLWSPVTGIPAIGYEDGIMSQYSTTMSTENPMYDVACAGGNCSWTTPDSRDGLVLPTGTVCRATSDPGGCPTVTCHLRDGTPLQLTMSQVGSSVCPSAPQYNPCA